MAVSPRTTATAIASVLTAIAFPTAAADAKPEIELVSRGAAGADADADASDPTVSRDGRFVAFESTATNLHPDDSDAVLDVFVRDLESGTTTLVSRASGAMGAKGDAASVDPSISADARFVAFTSIADNLVSGPAPQGAQVFVRDLVSGTTTLVSRTSGPGGAPGDNVSREPAISADGRFVAFHSWANLVPEDDSWTDVYVRDLAAGTTTLASRASGAEGVKGNDESYDASISGDGSRVAFTSYATSIHVDAAWRRGSVFVRDLRTNTTTLESRSSGRPGKPGNSEAGSPRISSDGTRLAFWSVSTNLVPGPEGPFTDIYTRSLSSRRTSIVSRGVSARRGLEPESPGALTTSASGRRLAFGYDFETPPRRDPDRELVFVADVRKETVKRVSGLVGQVRFSEDRFDLALSGNGRWLAVQSERRLSPDDQDGSTDVFILRLER